MAEDYICQTMGTRYQTLPTGGLNGKDVAAEVAVAPYSGATRSPESG